MRALGSTLDNFAAVIVGIHGLPVEILTIDWWKMVNVLRKVSDATTPQGEIHRSLRQRLYETIRNGRPTGWLEWSLDMRNMLVHRARRMNMFFPRLLAPGLTVAASPAVAGDGLVAVSERVDTIESSLGDGTEDVSQRIDDVESNLGDLQDCVNDYLRAVDASRGGSYRFRFC